MEQSPVGLLPSCHVLSFAAFPSCGDNVPKLGYFTAPSTLTR